MGLEFNFDEISLDQQVSREQLEIDLYDELITISDAEPDEQVRLLAVKPALGLSSPQDDKPESIKITGALGRDQAPAGGPMPPAGIMGAQPESPVVAAPADAAKSADPLSSYPPAVAAGRDVPIPPLPQNGLMSGSIGQPGPSPKATEITAPPINVQAPATRPKSAQPPAPVPKRPVLPAPSAEAPGSKCSECGQPAGELDMICIECGAFIG